MTADGDELMKALGLAMKRRRRVSGLSQERAADLAGVAAGTIIRIERGENTGLETLLKLSQVYECRLMITLQRHDR